MLFHEIDWVLLGRNRQLVHEAFRPTFGEVSASRVNSSADRRGRSSQLASKDRIGDGGNDRRCPGLAHATGRLRAFNDADLNGLSFDEVLSRLRRLMGDARVPEVVALAKEAMTEAEFAQKVEERFAVWTRRYFRRDKFANWHLVRRECHRAHSLHRLRTRKNGYCANSGGSATGRP
jgi:hypothetical protein